METLKLVYMKRVLLLNASYNDEGMLKALKNLGCYVITTGNKPELAGHKFADEYVFADYTDLDQILRIAIDKRVDAICPCANDHGVRVAAYVSEKLGFKGQDTYENTLIIANKDKFKDFAQKNEIKTPKAYEFDNKEKTLVWAKNNKMFPLMVKASDLCGGLGINKANNTEELIKDIENSFDKSLVKRIVIEQFIEGSLHGLCTYLINKKVVAYSSDSEYCIKNPYKVEMYKIPGNYIDEVKEDLIKQIEKMANLLDLSDGIFHLQYIYNNGEAYIIECMRRVLGNMYGLLSSRYNGFDWDYWQVKAICGFGVEDFPKNIKQTGCYGFKALLANSDGFIKNSEIDSELEKKIIYKRVLHKNGEYIDNYMSNPLSINFFEFNNKEEAIELLINRYDKSYVEIEKKGELI